MLRNNWGLLASIAAFFGPPAVARRSQPKVLSDRFGNRSKYKPHQGAREKARRVRQRLTSPEV